MAANGRTVENRRDACQRAGGRVDEDAVRDAAIRLDQVEVEIEVKR